jgi:hypothetical protein
MMIPIKKVCAQLGLSRESVRQLEKKGRLTKHKLVLTGERKTKQTAARYDSDEVDRLELELKGGRGGADPAAAATLKRPRSRSAPPPGFLATGRKRKLIDFG